jgi:hypothetical protein
MLNELAAAALGTGGGNGLSAGLSEPSNEGLPLLQAPATSAVMTARPSQGDDGNCMSRQASKKPRPSLNDWGYACRAALFELPIRGLVLACCVAACERSHERVPGQGRPEQPSAEGAARMVGQQSARNGPEPERLAVLNGERVYELGEQALARDYRMRLLDVMRCQVESHFAPEPVNVLLSVRIELEGLSKRGVSANPFYATLHGTNGDTHASRPAGCRPLLQAATLSRGAKVEGYVTFEVPRAGRRFELRYAPQVIGAGVQELRFRVWLP